MKTVFLSASIFLSCLSVYCQGNTKPILLSIGGSAPMADEPLQNVQGEELTLNQAKKEKTVTHRQFTLCHIDGERYLLGM